MIDKEKNYERGREGATGRPEQGKRGNQRQGKTEKSKREKKSG